jgi:hypothetical protein
MTMNLGSKVNSEKTISLLAITAASESLNKYTIYINIPLHLS